MVTTNSEHFSHPGARDVTLAAAYPDGSIALLPTDPTDPRPVVRLLGSPDVDWVPSLQKEMHLPSS
jgi:hypothetical protein